MEAKENLIKKLNVAKKLYECKMVNENLKKDITKKIAELIGSKRKKKNDLSFNKIEAENCKKDVFAGKQKIYLPNEPEYKKLNKKYIFISLGITVFSIPWLIYYLSDQNQYFWGLIIWAIVFSIACLILTLNISYVLLKNISFKKEYNKKLFEYNEKKELIDQENAKRKYKKETEIEVLIKEDENSIEELGKKIDKLDQVRNLLDEHLEIIEKTIEFFHDHTQIIYESYQEFIPICQFIQYLESGRCKTLEGTNGCYNLYENELNQYIIKDNLEFINEDLEIIKKSQIVAYKTLKSIKTKSEQLYFEIINEDFEGFDEKEQDTNIKKYMDAIGKYDKLLNIKLNSDETIEYLEKINIL